MLTCISNVLNSEGVDWTLSWETCTSSSVSLFSSAEEDGDNLSFSLQTEMQITVLSKNLATTPWFWIRFFSCMNMFYYHYCYQFFSFNPEKSLFTCFINSFVRHTCEKYGITHALKTRDRRRTAWMKTCQFVFNVLWHCIKISQSGSNKRTAKRIVCCKCSKLNSSLIFHYVQYQIFASS